MADPTSWRPSAGLDTLRWRARCVARVRDFFAARGVWEVETPLLSAAAATDPGLNALSSRVAVSRPHRRYWHTSPEFPMKRLLAAGSGPIYQICHAFRDGELGRLHNPEFTLLEWYRPGYDEWHLMDELEELLGTLLPSVAGAQRLSYREAFAGRLGLDPLTADAESCRRCCLDQDLTVAAPATAGRDFWLDLLMSHVIGPGLGRGAPCFVYDYPASQAALARLTPGPPAVAARFELYLNGVEVANGFHELADAGEQAERFEADLRQRRRAGLECPPVDTRLLAALRAGLPDCAGVAVGLDRLLMLAAGAQSLDQVMAFPWPIA